MQFLNTLTIYQIILLSIISIATLIDLKTRKIYNLLTFPAILLGIILNAFFTPAFSLSAGLIFSLKGLLLGILFFFIPFSLGGLGAGDLKLLGVVGSFMGLKFVFYCGLFSSIAGGLMALIVMIFNKQKWTSSFTLFKNLFFALLTKTKAPRVDPENSKRFFPYSLSILLGTLITLYFKI